ncbi:DUF6777 domain-containing protein [Streptomyces sp. MAR4 CNX-425]|uniref:DUF6777 domain-containing protein n=1 Tax=Streptomyces sp. MAR4 CNX-425 TaxID=3406343 RepID=UPI003B511D8A
MPRLRSARRAPRPARPTPRPPRAAHLAGAAAAALALSVTAGACAAPGQGGRAAAVDPPAELVMQPVAESGTDPFTATTATPDGADPSPARTAPPPGGAPPAKPGTYQQVSGATAGLYAGVRNVASCDVDKQIELLDRDEEKVTAFAGALGVEEAGLPDYLRGLTSVLLRADTRLTGHGFADGEARAYQAVLQSGSAVLVDDRGVPRVRCASGAPLTAPEELSADGRYGGTGWRGYRPSRTVVVTPAKEALSHLVIVDVTTNLWFERPVGARSGQDRKLPQPPPNPFAPPSPEPGRSPGGGTTKSPGPTDTPTDTPTDAPTDSPTGEPTDGPGTGTGEPTTAPPMPGGVTEPDHERVNAGGRDGEDASAR